TPGVMLWDRAQLTGRVRVHRIAEAGPAAWAALDRAGVDLKVVLIHSGFGESSYDTSGGGPENDAAALAAMTPKPDLVIVGHTHREMRDTVIKGVHFVQPKNWVQSLAVVHVSLAKDSARAGRYRVTAVRSDLIPLANVAESPRFTQRVRAAHEAARDFTIYEPGRPLINDSVAGFNYDVVSGVVYNIDLSRPAGLRIRGLAYNGKIVQPGDSFTMAVNSYRQAGGGGYAMIARAR